MTLLEERYARRTTALVQLMKWPVIGGLLALGAIAVTKWIGGEVADELGQRGGQAFARGVAEAQERLAAVSGWGVYR